MQVERLRGYQSISAVARDRADANGVGGTIVLDPTVVSGVSATAFTGITQVALTNGSGYVVYEVLSANSLFAESCEIPVFVVAPANNSCSTVSTNVVAELAPVSTVATATTTDPLPRYTAATTFPTDCTVNLDCNAYYFPALSVNQTSLALTAQSLGLPQSASVTVTNTGKGQLNFAASITYPAGTASGWLSVSPSGGVASNTVLTVTADPQGVNGVYTASLIVDAGATGIITRYQSHSDCQDARRYDSGDCECGVIHCERAGDAGLLRRYLRVESDGWECDGYDQPDSGHRRFLQRGARELQYAVDDCS